MLESLQQTNIGSLTLEEPQPRLDLPFNPVTDLTEEDLGFLKDYVYITSPAQDLEHVESQFYYHILNSKEDNELSWNPPVEGLNSDSRRDVDRLISVVGAIKTVFPAKFSSLPIDMYLLKLRLTQNINFLGIGGGSRFVNEVASFAIAYPEEDTAELKEKVLNGWEGTLSWLKKQTTSWFYELDSLANLRILSEEIFQDFHLSNEKLLQMKKGLMETRESARRAGGEWWGEFLKYGAYLAIISAEKVEITNKGLELTMPGLEPELIQTTPSLPEMRKF
ncbi:MAG: hypothetical protein Q7R49_01920 [Candidatus Daviesbacteria bacterium]|nr:hypothetical protein [Candidatus Daviesbacteria bacterium]